MNIIRIRNFEKEVKLLMKVLNCTKALAATLIFFLREKGGKSVDIERTMDLRQPEVSVAIRKLTDKGIVKMSISHGNRLGRPDYYYEVSSGDAVLEMIRKEAFAQIKKVQDNLKEFLEIASLLTDKR